MSLKHDLYLSRKPFAGFLAIGIAWSTYFAQMPVIKAQVGASDGAYGMAILLAALGAVAAMWLAPACQKYAKGMAFPLGIFVVGVGMFSTGLSSGLIVLTLALLVASAGSGVVDVLINARVAELEAQTGRALMNLNHALYSFAYATGAGLTGLWRTLGLGPVQILAVLCLILLGLALWARDTPTEVEIEDDAQAAARLPRAVVILGGLVVLIAFLTEASTEGWSALHLERGLGATPAQGAMGPAVLGLMMGIGRISGHAASRVVRDIPLMIAAGILAAAGIGVAAFASNVPLALMGFALAGLGISVVAPLALAIVGRSVAPSKRLAAISRVSAMGYGAFFLGPPLMGMLAEGFGLPVAFAAVAALALVMSLALVPMLARQAK